LLGGEPIEKFRLDSAPVGPLSLDPRLEAGSVWKKHPGKKRSSVLIDRRFDLASERGVRATSEALRFPQSLNVEINRCPGPDTK
jgi:hypothetical protein